jgi:exopolysaccharide biosynthesis protein
VMSGGPILVHRGKRMGLKKPTGFGLLPYEIRSMKERHPRTALGWNDRYFYLVQVDGRQRLLSVGMTLPELTSYMLNLGCREVMNLDGGGSSEMWCHGRVVSSPCDHQERDIANSLIVVTKSRSAPTAGTTNSTAAN